MDTMDATENPAASTELPEEVAKAQQEGDDDDMESGGPINSEETVRLLVAVVDERIEGSRGDDGPEQGSGGIGDLVAHLVRTEITPPSNFHQCTVYYLTSEAAEDEDLRSARGSGARDASRQLRPGVRPDCHGDFDLGRNQLPCV